MSEMTFNTSLVNLLSQYGIPVHFFNYYSFYTEAFIRENIWSLEIFWLVRLSTIRIMRSEWNWPKHL